MTLTRLTLAMTMTIANDKNILRRGSDNGDDAYGDIEGDVRGGKGTEGKRGRERRIKL